MRTQQKVPGRDQAHWPDDLRYLWDKTLSAADLGGLVSTRGFYYQYLYCLPLMADILAGRYTAYTFEVPEDFTAWQCDANGRISRLCFIQLKSALPACFLSAADDVRRVLRNFKRAAVSIGSLQTAPDVEFRLACNAHPTCSAGCESGLVAREKRGLNRFKRDVQAVFPNSSITLRFEHYLPIPASQVDFLNQVQFLKDEEPRLLHFLDSSENLSALVRHLIGAILPYHTSRSGMSLRQAAALSSSVLPLQLQHDRTDVIEELRLALRSAADRALGSQSDRSLCALQVKAKEQAAKELKAARPSASVPEVAPAIAYSDRKEALAALQVIYRLRGEGGCLFQPGEFQVSINSESFWIAPKVKDRALRLVQTLLRRSDCTHARRVELILSFSRAVSQWARVGLRFDGIRTYDPKHRELYLVRRSSSFLNTFVLADLDILSVQDPTEQLLGSEWVRGVAIGDAVRYLYYGTSSKEGAQRTAQYRKRWNDNLAFEIAARFDGVGLIHAEMLERELASALQDERERWPLLFHAVDEQFVCDITDAGFRSVSDAVATVLPTRLLLDRGLRFREVYYAFSEEAQIGLLHSPKSLSFTLYRYIPYLTRRWERTRERDWGASVPLDLRGRASGVFVGVRDASDVTQTITDLFGRSEADYQRWLERLLREAASRQGFAVLPEVLRPETELLDLRRRRLDLLRQIEVPFEMFVDNAEAATVGDTVMLSMVGDNHLGTRLKRLGYFFVDDRSGLYVSATDSEGRRLRGILRRCVSEPPDEVIYVDLTLLDAGFSPYGRLRISDPGSDAVISSEETLLRELGFSLSSGQKETATLQAWRMLEPCLGTDPLRRRSSA